MYEPIPAFPFNRAMLYKTVLGNRHNHNNGLCSQNVIICALRKCTGYCEVAGSLAVPLGQ